MNVRDVLRNKADGVVTIEPAASAGADARLLIRHGIGGLPVVSLRGELEGFLSERDLVRAVDERPGSIQDVPVERIMQQPAPTCSADDPLMDIMGRMTRHRLRHLVVVDGEGVAGVLSVGDLVRHRLEQLELEAGILRDYVASQRAAR
jgi:CBS domain-containing protein